MPLSSFPLLFLIFLYCHKLCSSLLKLFPFNTTPFLPFCLSLLLLKQSHFLPSSVPPVPPSESLRSQPLGCISARFRDKQAQLDCSAAGEKGRVTLQTVQMKGKTIVLYLSQATFIVQMWCYIYVNTMLYMSLF